MRVIAVDDSLSNVRRALTAAGYQVIGNRPEEIGRADAVIVNGIDINFNGVQEIMNKAPVINASSRSAADIIEELNRRFAK